MISQLRLFRDLSRCVLALICATFSVYTVPANGSQNLFETQNTFGSLSQEKILKSASEIRKLSGNPATDLTRDQKNNSAKRHFERGLSVWRGSSGEQVSTLNQFAAGPVKLFDAYAYYLIESKQPSLAIEVLQTAILEADKDRNYQWGEIFRIQLADILASIGQIEVAQNIINEAQALSDRVYGELSATTQNPDPVQLAENAAFISASIRIGGTVDQTRISLFAKLYEKSIESNPIARFITPIATNQTLGTYQMNDDKYYRRDQEYWRWISIGAIRVGDRRLAKTSLEHMLRAAEVASNNTYATAYDEDKVLKGGYEDRAKLHMISFNIDPHSLKYQKFSDTAFGLETIFDSSLAGAEIYLMLGEPALAEKLITRAINTLPSINRFSVELQKLGHLGLNVEQRTGELNRVTAKLYIQNKRWNDALLQLNQYLAWSEIYRNSLSLEERIPYFRGKSQGSYLDALLARASLFLSTPLEPNFNLALEALGNMKARQLRDALEVGGKAKSNHVISAKNNIDAILKSGKAYISIADTGEDLIVFFADKDERKIRIARKPKDFDRGILSLRKNLAEQQIFDSVRARNITTLVLGELEDKVFKEQKLVVETDGLLSFLPVELWMSSKMIPLGMNTVVSYIPTLAMAYVSKSSNAAKGILAFGDAQFDQKQQITAIGADKEYELRGKRRSLGFAPLPETRDEINAIIQSAHEGGKAILGTNATKSGFFREARRTPYRYLHFATHGVVGGEIPRLNEPALILTPESNDPGFLTATEIGKMDINADLVVLSACNSGNGEYFNGEGLMGLGRAFILAGAKAVVVSLWPVDSVTTKDMMIRFYRDLEATGDPSLALASARKSIMLEEASVSKETRAPKKKSRGSVPVTINFTGHENPFFWAPFILVESGL
jgi:CHAT domain-containing protein